jgi:polyisoprenoid-binding protein YceI
MIMQASPGHTTAPALQAWLQDGTLAGEWILDPRRSSIQVTTRSLWGLVPVTGVFGQVRGTGSVRPSGEVSGTVTVAAASLDTRNARRDRHLRSADFFDSGNYPDITFIAGGIRPLDRGVAVTGALTVRGRTRPLAFDAAASAHGDGQIRFDAEVRINRAGFGLTWSLLGMASVHNTVTIHATFTRR